MQDDNRPHRAPGIEVNEVADGLVVYQDDPERVHYLNSTASVVFELCTGDNTETEIVALLGEAFVLGAPPQREVEACLAHLRHEGIVQ